MKKINKIITKSEIRRNLEIKANRLLICTARKKYKHCISNCFHGIPHEKESGRDACHRNHEICKIQPGIIRVICRHLNLQEKKEWIKKEMI